MGGSSGGSSHTPVEAPESGRSKQRAKIVEVVSEGEIGGLIDGLKSVYLDNTPIQNADGTYNFKNVEAQGRTGTQDQDVMSDFDTTEKEISVGAEVKKTTPLTRTVTDANVTRLRLTLGVQSLFKQEDNGDTNGTAVDFKITVGSATYHLNINGKYSSQYLRTMIIENLPKVPFTVRIERLTDDSDSQRLQNKTVWASYTEIIDTEFAYPNTAYVGIKFDSEYFSNIPNRTYEVKGIKVKVPSNYNTMTRKYNGLWDGTFKIDWTDNPAWVLLDILTNKRYGLGERLGDFSVDKWALYSIAQYCDQLVPDGFGKMEPRFTCNIWMTEQRSAYDVISDLCSIFRAIPVWNGTEMTFIIDRPADPVWTYTNANVINGEFSRRYSAKKARHNAIQVEYKDKDNSYQSAIEYVSDDDLIRKSGFNLKKVTAFGCTSRGQAYRTGRWILETEKLETETVTFSVGSEGLMHIPGDIIRVTDNHFAGTNLGGRVVSVKGKVVTVDREITLPANSYFSYINAEAKHAAIKVTKIENGTKLTLETAPAGLKAYDVYSISSQKVTSRLYRCMTITEDDGTYTITALQHEPQKEAIVDNGASFEPSNTSLLGAGLQKVSNANVSLSENGVEISFDYAANTTTAVKYQVKLYRNGELYRQLVDLTDTKLTFSNLPDGVYTVEIRAKNERGQLSDPITRTFEINLRIPRFITKSLLFAIELDWDLPKTATVGNYTEIWRAPENDVSKAVKIATLPYPQNNYTINGVSLAENYYFFARCGDKAGNKGEFTEGVFGEADHNPDNLLNALEGQITQSHLGKSLIDSLKADIDNAVGEEGKQRQGAVANALAQLLAETQARVKAIQDEAKARTASITAEANNRTKAIQAESASLTKKIQAETKARGTAVTQLQQTDAQQAQLITAVTAKADQAIAGLQEEKTARANADKAEAQARNALTSRVASAESGIAEVRQSIATANSSIAEVSQNLNAKIDGLSVGGRNLLRDSKIEYVGNRYGSAFALANIPDVGEMVTVTLWGQLAADRRAFAVYNTHGHRELAQLKKVRDGVYTATFAWNRPLNNREEKDNSLSTHLSVYAYPRSATSDNTIERIKLERGTIATDWTPAPEDADSTISAVSADLTSYKQTQATQEQATSQQINGLTTRLANAEGGISRVEKTVSDNQSSTATRLNQLSANLTKAQTDLNAKITQEQTARANADKANADRITAVTSRVASAESSISNIQSTKASKTEVASLAQQSLQAVWQADAQTKVDALKIGGRNLLLNSSSNYTGSRYMTNWSLAKIPDVGQQVTVTLWGELASDRQAFAVYNTHGFRELARLTKLRDGVYSATFVWRNPLNGNEEKDNALSTHLNVYAYPRTATSDNTIKQVKLEIGNVATDWTPAPEDSDSAINAISSKVDSVQQTLTTANQALGSRIDTVTASVNDAKSQVSQVSKTVSDVSGKLSATSTLKTQVIAGGRKAIAGIALGAESDGVTTESSVIVMADKFGIVANANDGKVKPVFSVANGQVGIRGDLFVAGSVTNDKLSSGSGANLLQNPIFSNDAHSWYDNKGNGSLEPLVTKLTRRTSQSFAGLVSSGAVLISEVTANQSVSSWWQVAAQKVSVIPGQRYCFSAYVDAWSCTGELMIQEWDATDNWVKDFAYSGKFGRNISGYSQSGAMEEKTGNIDSRTRKSVFFTAPQSGIVALVVRMADIQRSSTIKVANAMLEECNASSLEPSSWSNSGAGPVHGGSIIANTIRGEHIMANQRISAPVIDGGSLNINNRFVVDSNGNVEIRSASGNVGLVIRNERIDVYDDRGNLEVRLGKLR